MITTLKIVICTLALGGIVVCVAEQVKDHGVRRVLYSDFGVMPTVPSKRLRADSYYDVTSLLQNREKEILSILQRAPNSSVETGDIDRLILVFDDNKEICVTEAGVVTGLGDPRKLSKGQFAKLKEDFWYWMPKTSELLK